MAFYTDEKGKLVPYAGDVPQEAIMAIEAADEQTIVERLTRLDAQSVFAYSYPVKTKEGIKDIIGISVDGAKEIANLLGNIKVSSEIKVEEKDDYFYAIVPVTNLIRNVTLIGAGAQSKYILGEGNEPTSRVDVLAFVKSISKAQRNGILSIASQEIIAEIVSKLSVKAIKKLPAPPAYGKAPPPKAEKPPAEGEEEVNLKKLRQQVSMAWQEATGRSTEERKAWQKAQYGVTSLTELPREKLEDMLAKIKEMAKPAKAGLGFSSEAEQTQMRTELFGLIDGLGHKTDDEKRAYIAQKGWGKTTELPKEKLQACIEEVSQEKKVIVEAGKISEEI